MKNVTVSLDEGLIERAQAAAAREGKSLSDYMAEAMERQIGKPAPPSISQREALRRFLAGPPLHVVDENGRVPSRDQRYE